MNMTISPQIRIVAAVGLLAAVALGGLLFLRGGSSGKTETAAPPARTQTTVHHVAPRPTRTHAKPATTKPVVHAAKPAVHHAKPKPAGYRGNPVYAALPHALQWQLAHHKVVVVTVYNPRSDVDAITVAEAHAGAIEAGAGFLLVSVLDNDVAGILTALLPSGGLLPNPGVLVYRAPGDIALRLDGFSDREAVAQAATNAMHGETGPAPANSLSASAAVPATTSAPAATVTP